MADFSVPVDWKFDGDSKDSSTYLLPGHLVGEPYFVIFDRKVPTFNGQNSAVHQYRIRIFRGVPDAEGALHPSKMMRDYTARWPTEADSTKNKALDALMSSILADVNISSDIVDEQYLPRG